MDLKMTESYGEECVVDRYQSMSALVRTRLCIYNF